MKFIVICLLVLVGPVCAQSSAQNSAPAPASGMPKAGGNEAFESKSYELKFIDPDEVRKMFANRSFLMEVNRDLRVLTVHGPAAFQKEVEDTVKRFDIAPAPPANLQVTFYLLTGNAQTALPAELSGLGKETGGLKLADSEMVRIREDLGGETNTSGTPEAKRAKLSRVRFQSAVVYQGKKGDAVSLNGLQIWLDMPSDSTDASHAPANSLPDVAADIDIDANEPALIAKLGADKPVVVAVRASVIR